MATRHGRLAQFNPGTPRTGVPVEVLCEDHNGTYTLPFACNWDGDAWRNAATGDALTAAVVGWRER